MSINTLKPVWFRPNALLSRSRREQCPDEARERRVSQDHHKHNGQRLSAPAES